MMHRGKLLPLILALIMLIAALGAPASFAQSGKPDALEATGLEPDSTVSLPDKQPAVQASSMASVGSSAGEELVSVIVKLTDAPLTARAGADGLDVQSAESRAYLDYLAVQQEDFISVAKATLSDVRVTHRFDIVLGGVSIVCFALATRAEDRFNVAKFGEPYRVYMKQVPALNLPASSTRKEERLYGPDNTLRLAQLRRALTGVPPREAMEYLLNLLAKYPTNEELLQSINPDSISPHL